MASVTSGQLLPRASERRSRTLVHACMQWRWGQPRSAHRRDWMSRRSLFRVAFGVATCAWLIDAWCCGARRRSRRPVSTWAQRQRQSRDHPRGKGSSVLPGGAGEVHVAHGSHALGHGADCASCGADLRPDMRDVGWRSNAVAWVMGRGLCWAVDGCSVRPVEFDDREAWVLLVWTG